MPRGCGGSDVAAFFQPAVQVIMKGATVTADCKTRRDERTFYAGNMVVL